MSDVDVGRPAEGRSFDIRLLGFVRVRSDAGAQLDIGGPKPRAVLLRLALRAGEVVSTDSLVDTLWGDDPPLTARRSVQAHVAKLRASLGGGAGPLGSSGNGYVLDVPRDFVDVLRIEDALKSAGEALATDPAHAAELVSSGLRE